MTLAAEKRSSSGLLKGGSSAPQLPPIDSMAPSRSMPPRRLSLSVGSMKPRSRQSMLVSTAALGIEDKPVSVQARLRAERARKQRAERVERPNKKRGAHAREALRNDGPTWWTMPGKVSDSCEAFDRRHRNRWDTSETLIFSLQRDVTRISAQEAYQISLMELRMNRFFVPESAGGGPARYQRNARPIKKGKPWKLEDSIWEPRTRWCDSLDFYDTDACELAMFETDWKRALACGLGNYIDRMDDEEAGAVDDDGMNEVEEVNKVMWEFHDLIYVCFDYYSALGASDDFTHMTLNAFSQFVEDCKLVNNKSKYCKKTHFDQLFIAVDASSAGGKTDEKHNRKKALNRQEFLQCLVKVACMRYVQPGDIIDVSEAVHRFFSSDVEPRLDARVFVEGNEFRRRYLYAEPVDRVFRRYERSLRIIFEKLTRLQAQNAAAGLANKLVSFDCWKEFARLFDLYDEDLTERHIKLAFVSARMKVTDEQLQKTRVKLTHLSFEDFTESVARLAAHKALPTSEELEASGAECAGVYLRRMKEDSPEEYNNLVNQRARSWGSEPTLRFEQCVEHFCSLLVVTAQKRKGDNLELTEKEAASFFNVKVPYTGECHTDVLLGLRAAKVA